MTDLEKIKSENDKILQGFAASGTNLGVESEFEFRIELRNKEEAKAVRQKFQQHYKLPNEGMFVYANYKDRTELVIDVTMIPSVENVSVLEANILSVLDQKQRAGFSWEFKAVKQE